MDSNTRTIKMVSFIIVFTFASKILGFFREVMIASKFGAGEVTDSFFIALAAVSLFKVMITSSINTTMIPVLKEIESSEGKSAKISHTNNFLNITIITSLLITMLAIVFAPYIMRIFAMGYSGDKFVMSVQLMRIGLTIIVFSGIVGIFRGYLQSEFLFTESAISELPFNFVYILYLLFLSDKFGIYGLMVASVIAVLSQVLFQLPSLKKTGYKYIPKMNFRDKHLIRLARLIPPVILSVSISDINKIVDKSLASTLIDGSISALNYSNRLTSLVLGIFITAIVTVLFPLLSESVNNLDNFKKIIRDGITSILLITIPSTVGLMVLAEPLVKAIYERGSFDIVATKMTAISLVFYSIGLLGMAIRLFLDKVFYSMQDTKTPLKNGFIAVLINIVLNLILIRFMEYKGLALATSISATITTILLIISLTKKIGGFGMKRLTITFMKILSASLIMGIFVHVIFISLNPFIGSNLTLIISTITGSFIFAFLIIKLRIDGIDEIIRMFKRKFIRTPK